MNLHSILTGSGVSQWGGSNVVVIDSSDLCSSPSTVLHAALTKLGLPYSPSMLTWPKGPKPFDGVWAPQWYSSSHCSTTFNPPPAVPTYRTLPPLLLPLYTSALPLYTSLLTHAVPSKVRETRLQSNLLSLNPFRFAPLLNPLRRS